MVDRLIGNCKIGAAASSTGDGNEKVQGLRRVGRLYRRMAGYREYPFWLRIHIPGRRLKDRLDDSDGVVPQAPPDRPGIDLLRHNPPASRQIGLLPGAESGRQVRVFDENVVFVVEVETAPVRVR
ncbi:hypothetical protein NN6n1_04570 [Shinella zoogloeoides]